MKKKTITSTLENYYLHCMKNFTIFHEIEIKILSNSSKKKKKEIKNSHRTMHLPITDFGDRFIHEIAPIERDPVQNHCAQFTAAKSANRTSNDDATIDRLISRFARLYSPGKSTLLV